MFSINFFFFAVIAGIVSFCASNNDELSIEVSHTLDFTYNGPGEADYLPVNATFKILLTKSQALDVAESLAYMFYDARDFTLNSSDGHSIKCVGMLNSTVVDISIDAIFDKERKVIVIPFVVAYRLEG